MDISPLYLSLKLSLTTTILLILIASPVVYSLVFIKIPGKTFLDALINLPIVLPPTVIGFFMLIMMGPHGIGNLWERVTGSQLLFSFTGLVIASIIYNLPFAVAPMRAAFSRIDPRLIENAQVLGLSQYSVFFRVILPNSILGIAASSILVFLHTIGEFGVIFMIGGSIPGNTKVASIAIYEAVENMKYHDAWMMSLVLIPVSYIFLLTINYLNRGSRNYEP
jgi:molybdate transport system permease protein